MASSKIHCCNNNIKDKNTKEESEVEESHPSNSSSLPVISSNLDQSVSSGGQSTIAGDKGKSNNKHHQIAKKKNVDYNGNKLHINCIQIRFQPSHTNSSSSRQKEGNSEVKSKTDRIDRLNSASSSKTGHRHNTSSSSRVKCDDNNNRRRGMTHGRHNSSSSRRHKSSSGSRGHGRHHGKEREGEGLKSGQSVSKSNNNSQEGVSHGRRNSSSRQQQHGGQPIITIPIPMSNCSVICSSQKFLVVTTASPTAVVGCCCRCFHKPKVGHKSSEKTTKTQVTPSSSPPEGNKTFEEEEEEESDFPISKSESEKNETTVSLDNKQETKELRSTSRDPSVVLSTPPTIKGSNEADIQMSPIPFMTKKIRKSGTVGRKVSRSSSTSSVSSSSSSSCVEEEERETNVVEKCSGKKRKHRKESSGKKSKKTRHRHH